MNALLSKIKGFLKDPRGVAAVEFALIFPVMAALLLGAIETSQALEAKRKETSVAATVADLVAQEKSVDNSDMANIFQGATLILSPFDATNLKVVVSSIIKNAAGDAQVAWSDGYHVSPRAVGQIIDPSVFPTGILVSGSSVIMAEVTYSYTSSYNWNITAPLSMQDTYYCRPRRSVTVVRNNF